MFVCRCEANLPAILSRLIVDLTMDDAPEIDDTSRLGATISMLQEVIRSIERPSVPESSSGVPPSTAEVASIVSTTSAKALALVIATEIGEVGATGT